MDIDAVRPAVADDAQPWLMMPCRPVPHQRALAADHHLDPAVAIDIPGRQVSEP